MRLKHTEVQFIDFFLHRFLGVVDGGLLSQRDEGKILLVASEEEQASGSVHQVSIVVIGANAITEIEFVDVIAYGSCQKDDGRTGSTSLPSSL